MDDEEVDYIGGSAHDPHSGSRLVLIAWTLVLPIIVGIGAYYIVADVTQHSLGWESSRRAGYTAGGIAFFVIGIAMIAWIARLRPSAATSQNEYDDEEMPYDDEEGWNQDD